MNQDLLIILVTIGICILPVSFYWLLLGLEIFTMLTEQPRIASWLSKHLLVMDLLLLALGGPIIWYQFIRGRFYADS